MPRTPKGYRIACVLYAVFHGENGITFYASKDYIHPKSGILRTAGVWHNCIPWDFLIWGGHLAMKYMMKAMKAHEKATGGMEALDEWVSRSFPVLFEFLTETHMPDGKRRVTSSVTLFAKDGAWKMCLKDKSFGFTMWGEGPTVLDCAHHLDRKSVV